MGSSVHGRVSRFGPAWRKGMTITIRSVSTIVLLVCKRLIPWVSTQSHSAGIAAGLGAQTTPRDATAGHGVDAPAIAPGPPPPPQVPQSRAPGWGTTLPGGRQRSTRPAAAAEAVPAAPAGEVAAVLGGSCQRPPCP